MGARARMRLVPSLSLALAVGCVSAPKMDAGAELRSDVPQPDYPTAEDAVVALMDAAARGDAEAVGAVLGPDAEPLAAGTPEETQGDLQRLSMAYARGHALIAEDEGSVTLMLDSDARSWAFPIALVSAQGRWRYDTANGVQNVIDMRVARHETDAIRLLLAMVDAQKKYFVLNLGPGGVSTYAPKFRSEPGKRDGLLWPDELGEPLSPMGPIVEAFEASGYGDQIHHDKPAPLIGYWYRILTYQGPGAPGGAQNYIDDTGAMTGGFALLAWPEMYGQTGVKSFVALSDGEVWEQDLGEDTASLLEQLDGFDPRPGWERTQQY